MKVIVFFLIILTGFPMTSQDVFPTIKIKTSGAITDFVLKDMEVILTTDAGTIETYQVKDGKKTDFITLPESVDFMGNAIPSKIYSIDVLHEKLLIVTQGKHGFRNVILLSGSEIDTILFDTKDKLMVKKAAFINENQVLLGLMSNELLLYNLEKKETVYTSYASPYTFSDFYLSEDKHFAFTADESGIVHQIDLIDGNVNKEYSGINVDNVYKLVYKNGTIITAGQDRRVGIFHTLLNQKYYLQKDFLVYSVGLCKNGDTGAFCASEDNEVVLFNTQSKEELATLKGHKSTITKIEFLNDHTLITASDDQYLMIWNVGF